MSTTSERLEKLEVTLGMLADAILGKAQPTQTPMAVEPPKPAVPSVQAALATSEANEIAAVKAKHATPITAQTLCLTCSKLMATNGKAIHGDSHKGHVKHVYT